MAKTKHLSNDVPNHLGPYLKQLRLDKSRDSGTSITQAAVAKYLADRGVKATQGTVAQYELGNVAHPDPRVLQLLAKYYQLQYKELAFRAYVDEYGLSDWQDGFDATEQAIYASAIRLSEDVVGGSDIKLAILRTVTKLLESSTVLLDLPGMALWLDSRRDIKELWIFAPQFLDTNDGPIFKALLAGLRRGVTYHFFIRQTQEMHAFSLIQDKAHDSLGGTAKGRLLAHFFDEVDHELCVGLTWFNSGYIIANPNAFSAAVIFKNIHRCSYTFHGLQLDTSDTQKCLGELRDWIKQREELLTLLSSTRSRSTKK